MSTITIQQLEGVKPLKRDRLMNSMLAACAEAARKCGSCPHKRKPNPGPCITLMKTVASKYKSVLIDAFNLPDSTQFTVIRQNRQIMLQAH